MKGHPATIECIAEPVSHAVIECAEKVIPYKGPGESGRLKVIQLDSQNHPDPNGKRWHLQMQVRAKEVEEWFDSYVCRCEVWNKVEKLQRPKKVVSNNAVIVEAYLERKFQLEPVSTDLEVGKRLVLTCIPPKGKPDPEVYWLKDGNRVNSNSFPHVIINDYNHLIIENSTIPDSGNYTCVAECLGVEYRYANAKVNIFPVRAKLDSSGWTDWGSCAWSHSFTSASPQPSCQQTRYRLCATILSQSQYQNSATSAEDPSQLHSIDPKQPVISECPSPWVQTRNCSIASCIGTWNNLEQASSSPNLVVNVDASDKPFRVKEIAIYVGLFLLLAIILIIIAIVIARRRSHKWSGLHLVPYSHCLQGKGTCRQDKAGKKSRDLLLSSDFKQPSITIKNPSAVDPRQVDDYRRNNRTNTTNIIMDQYGNPVNGVLNETPVTMFGPSANQGIQMAASPGLLFSNGAPLVSISTVGPLLPPPPPPPPTSSLPPLPNNPTGLGRGSSSSDASAYTGSIPSTQYFLAGVSPHMMTSGRVIPNPPTAATTQPSEFIISPVNYCQVNALSPMINGIPNMNEIDDGSSRSPHGQQHQIQQPQQQLFNSSVLAPVSSGSSSGQSPANTATNTTAVGSGNGGSSNGSLGMSANNGLFPLNTATTGSGAYGADEVEPEVPAYMSSSRPSSGLYHELSLDRCSGEPDSGVHLGENPDFESIVRGSVSVDGGVLCLRESDVFLNIPQGAVRPNMITEFCLALCKDDRQRPVLGDQQTLLSPIVCFGGVHESLLKPATLSFPHCADLNQGTWLIRLLALSPSPTGASGVARDNLYTSYNSVGDELSGRTDNSTWQEVCVVGCESPKSSVFCHLDATTAHLLTATPQRYCLVGETRKNAFNTGTLSLSPSQIRTNSIHNTSIPSQQSSEGEDRGFIQIQPAVKMLRLAAFGGRLTPTMDYNIRVYVLADTKDALNHVLKAEVELNGRLLDSTKPFPFRDDGTGICFRIDEISAGWRSRLQTRIQEIPFRHIWSGTQMSMLHCAFSLEHIDPHCLFVSCRIMVYQENINAHHQVLVISSDHIERSLMPPSHSRGPSAIRPIYTDQPFGRSFRIPLRVRQRLCSLLDPQEGNADWRALARQMGMEGTITRISAMSSPTSVLLDIWEARHRTEPAPDDLKYLLLSIGRVDCSSLVDVEPEPTWESR
ncbi:unnamed protein product [Calicophoron daubneyi]|uniref:Netrin receptor UNC5 n=1 Tax=Calicophoron daubneyi TaxID=300641 RepID=A0AAV2TRL0_CALDB